MKISDLILVLKGYQGQYGDLEVRVGAYESSDAPVIPTLAVYDTKRVVLL